MICVEKTEFTLLNKIQYPEDLRKLSVDELPQLCNELRRDIIEEVAVNPGHLASSLGVAEITVALHYVYDTPEDRIVWDVGHQAYGHKILTGRRDQFCTNRKLGGIKPFPSPIESEYDTFACGHASNSVSAALGMAVAAKLEGKDNRHVVAVIGDGALSGGLAFEGLNNVSSSPNDLLIILNDNNMSIDRSVGGMKQYLLNLSTNETYNAIRFKAARWLHGKGMLNEDRRKGIIRLTNAVKSAISHQQNIFEGMNIRYFGPFDGHDVKELVRILRQMKDMKGPKLLHLHTQKGHGYAPAEKDVTVWHAPGKFNPDTGERLVDNDPTKPQKYQDVFGHTLLELAKQNPKIVGVTPAMPSGCSMNIMMKEMPSRTFDVGIAEGHAVTFSGGMAKDGLLPFCNIYSAFAQRAFDNIIHDVALLNLNVVFCFDRAGLVGEDGPTHHGAFDLAALRPIPNLTIASPLDEHELRRLMYTAQLPNKGPFVIRYPRGGGELQDWRCPLEEIEVGTGRKLHDGSDVAVLSIGPIGNNVTRAIEQMRQEGDTISVAHYDMRFLKPIDENILEEVGKKFKKIITVENGTKSGGLGSAVLEWMNDHGYEPRIVRLGLPDSFVEHGKVCELQKIVGLDEESIIKAIKEI
ncbi:1-deoxy-D-xylulose-5-phosphate synthase [Xylanibacter ruminicola]|jgi:1-deoxy-D-xylulose-5-phosphate synthase|uniref:1-deoxy-D-xylulose-5-phosphate synthase n=1 Tax=Xylanibacter ruminicola TaxID=839 RepID=A0A1H5UZR3_XYLRU|nr:1-deoxy-D-xylulose-5-phosphate synthase [Xylanibacter ruminicola]MCR5471162.1 1-deoxy-D-xylulose-5-phosphate synthase [Prevotella sp.]SEF79928.1 1-deoxy-D-xylulose-5-phosphate synthase [Xylanibacter ruminicola]SEW26130.1 1-deoxy-D-xylulose-5-phosphate synthase [Prevotella sp. khp7]